MGTDSRIFQDFDYRVQKWRLRCLVCDAMVREDSPAWPTLTHAKTCRVTTGFVMRAPGFTSAGKEHLSFVTREGRLSSRRHDAMVYASEADAWAHFRSVPDLGCWDNAKVFTEPADGPHAPVETP